MSFTAPGSTGGSAITGYTATSSRGNVTATCTVSPCVVAGLTNGVAYTFTIYATNTVGNSTAVGAGAAVTPLAKPGIPTAPRSTSTNCPPMTAVPGPWSPPTPVRSPPTP